MFEEYSKCCWTQEFLGGTEHGLGCPLHLNNHNNPKEQKDKDERKRLYNLYASNK